MEVRERFGWHLLDRARALRVRERLADFESMTWAEILGRGDQHHPVAVSDLAPEARRRLTQLRLEDLDDLISLRLSGRERVWGFPDQVLPSILHLLWWDPDHEVCPAPLRHT